MSGNKWGMKMRRTLAFVLTSILGSVACATTVPLDLESLGFAFDGGLTEDSGIAAANGGFPGEIGGYSAGGFSTTVTGGFYNPSTGGRPPRMSGTGGRSLEFPNTGGRPATAGTGGSKPGSATTGGAPSGAGGASCRQGEKVCGGVCVTPAPRTGCGTTGCTPCSNTAPANGVVTCTNQQCDFSCLSGYTKSGTSCTAPAGSGGSTGGGGTPGPAVSCGGKTCPSCSIILGPACCNGNQCGCPLIPWTAGVLGCI